MSEQTILSEYEYLLGARGAAMRGDRASYESFIRDIREDISGEYTHDIDRKIERWLDITHVTYWKQSQAVEFYIQGKMLYRDGFYEAAIMVARSVCERVCYEMLDGVAHPFGGRESVEKESFRKLARFLLEEAAVLPQRSYVLMSEIYDIGNNYVHPKSNQAPKDDSRLALLKLGEGLWYLFGATAEDLKVGVKLQTAYAAFPEICTSYHFSLDAFMTPEAAADEARRWGLDVEPGYDVPQGHD